MKMNLVRRAALGLSMTILLGCGRGDGLADVHGTVTFNRTPVKEGTINFFAVDGLAPTAAAIIADGRYSTRAAPGDKRVCIESFPYPVQYVVVAVEPSESLEGI